MTPLSSVAMLEKLALLRMAFCSAPVLRSASCRRTSAPASAVVVSSVLVAAAMCLLAEHGSPAARLSVLVCTAGTCLNRGVRQEELPMKQTIGGTRGLDGRARGAAGRVRISEMPQRVQKLEQATGSRVTSAPLTSPEGARVHGRAVLLTV